jgi:5'-phosphate synthase pdxT subunit
MKIGVLALQGDFDAHRRRLEELGAEVVLVKKPEQLNDIDGLIIPGGESGTFLKLLGEEGFAKLKDFVRVKAGGPYLRGDTVLPLTLRSINWGCATSHAL